MDKLKDKYEILLGFITIVISFSAFRQELKAVNINLGFIDFNLSQYFLIIVIGLLFSIYLYTAESVLSKTKLGNWKGFNYLIIIAYTVFVIILFSPLLIGLSFLGKILIDLTILHKTNSILANLISSLIAALLGVITSTVLSVKIIKVKGEIYIMKLDEEIIKDLDAARRFYNDEYYSQSIFEAYKVLEIYLYKRISARNVRVRRDNFQDLTVASMKLGIINQNELSTIQDIRNMRNIAAHKDNEFTKDQAKKTIDFINNLIKESPPND